MKQPLSRRRVLQTTIVLGLLLVVSIGVRAIIINEPLVPTHHPHPLEERTLLADELGRDTLHVEQDELLQMVLGGDASGAFDLAFTLGDLHFGVPFTQVDGSGANVGDGSRYTRVPRSDLNGPGEWANHVPRRATGPNGNSCAECHSLPAEDGAGGPQGNVHRDPLHSGNLSSMITRNPPHLFGSGAVQLLAEEMTKRLRRIRTLAIQEANATNTTVTMDLVTKGVNFGTITANPGDTVDTVDTSGVVGVDTDLIVKPFQWKGENAALRFFNRGAMHNELGMTPVELVGEGVDSDGDGVVNEMTIGDITALTVYNAAQPRPTTLAELSDLGIGLPLPADTRQAIERGELRFRQAGCADCHVESMILRDPVFREPSSTRPFRDGNLLPSGQDPLVEGLDPANPVSFDLTTDLPDNLVFLESGAIFGLGNFETNERGQAIVRLFGDLKRHDLGPGLAENIDEIGTGASVFLTENLWGVGSTAPYMHDGRATTLTEAILEHGGEAAGSRAAFIAFTEAQQADLIAFLNNLVLFKAE